MGPQIRKMAFAISVQEIIAKYIQKYLWGYAHCRRPLSLAAVGCELTVAEHGAVPLPLILMFVARCEVVGFAGFAIPKNTLLPFDIDVDVKCIETQTGSWRCNSGGILKSFWDHFGVILGSRRALGGSGRALGSQDPSKIDF